MSRKLSSHVKICQVLLLNSSLDEPTRSSRQMDAIDHFHSANETTTKKQRHKMMIKHWSNCFHNHHNTSSNYNGTKSINPRCFDHSRDNINDIPLFLSPTSNIYSVKLSVLLIQNWVFFFFLNKILFLLKPIKYPCKWPNNLTQSLLDIINKPYYIELSIIFISIDIHAKNCT